MTKNYELIKGKRWQIGEVTIDSIFEAEFRLSDMGLKVQQILPRARLDREELGWMVPEFADDSFDMKSCYQSFLIKSRGKNILVDTACNVPGPYDENLLAAGCTPEDIDYVMFTHLHFDHAARNTKMAPRAALAPYFPNARYLFVRENYEFLKDLYDHPEKRRGNPYYDHTWPYLLCCLPLVEQGKVDFIDETFTLNNAISLYSEPGHMPGMVAVVVKSEGDSAYISDICNNPLQFTQIDVCPHWDHDSKVAAQTRRKVFEELADTDTMFFGPHFTGDHGYFVTRNGKGAYMLRK